MNNARVLKLIARKHKLMENESVNYNLLRKINRNLRNELKKSDANE